MVWRPGSRDSEYALAWDRGDRHRSVDRADILHVRLQFQPPAKVSRQTTLSGDYPSCYGRHHHVMAHADRAIAIGRSRLVQSKPACTSIPWAPLSSDPKCRFADYMLSYHKIGINNTCTAIPNVARLDLLEDNGPISHWKTQAQR